MSDDNIDRSHHDHEHSPPGPHRLPKPPIDADADLRRLPWMPLEIQALTDSVFFNSSNAALLRAGLRLWMKSWHQVPAASLPNNIYVIASMCGYPLADLDENSEEFASRKRLAEQSQHGYRLHADGRLYHPVIAQHAVEAWKKYKGKRKGQRAARLSRLRNKEEMEVADDLQNIGTPLADSSQNGGKSGLQGQGQRQGKKNPPYPPAGETRAEASPSAQEREAPASPAERGSATTEFADRPTSPPTGRSRDIDPEASAVRKQTMDNSSLRAEFGLTATEMLDALHQACFGSNRLIANSPKLESAEAIIALMRDNPAVSFTLDVLPAIKARVSRAGDKIGSWAFFGDAIKGWSQNRVSGTGSGRHDGPQEGYEAGNLPKWWRGWEDGEPPPGHPWPKRVIDERTRELRRYGGHWDWQWFDRVGKYQRTGEWDGSFAKELPGRPSSSCPDDICAHYGIKPQARREGSPIIDMRVVREVQAARAARESAREGRGEAKAMPPAPEGGALAKAMGGLPTSVAGQADDIPPKARAAVASAIANAVELTPDANGFYREPGAAGQLAQEDDAPPF